MSAVKSLADHKRRHDALLAAGKRDAASKLRWDMRKRAKADGEPVPSWAIAPPPQRPKKPGAKAAPPKSPSPVFTPGKPFELPRALREWRAGAGDRAVSFANDGTVTLFRATFSGRVKATFPSVDAAAAAVEPAIAWKPIAEAPPLSWYTQARAQKARRANGNA